jgi:hypothetical protein
MWSGDASPSVRSQAEGHTWCQIRSDRVEKRGAGPGRRAPPGRRRAHSRPPETVVRSRPGRSPTWCLALSSDVWSHRSRVHGGREGVPTASRHAPSRTASVSAPGAVALAREPVDAGRAVGANESELDRTGVVVARPDARLLGPATETRPFRRHREDGTARRAPAWRLRHEGGRRGGAGPESGVAVGRHCDGASPDATRDDRSLAGRPRARSRCWSSREARKGERHPGSEGRAPRETWQRVIPVEPRLPVCPATRHPLR